MPHKEPVLVSKSKEKPKSPPTISNVEPIVISDDEFDSSFEACWETFQHPNARKKSTISIISVDTSISTELNSVHNDDHVQQTEYQHGIDYPIGSNDHHTENVVQPIERRNDSGTVVPSFESLLSVIPNQTEKESSVNEENNNNGQAAAEDVETAQTHCHNDNVTLKATQSKRINSTQSRIKSKRRNHPFSSCHREARFQKIQYFPETDEESGDDIIIISDTDSTLSPLNFD